MRRSLLALLVAVATLSGCTAGSDPDVRFVGDGGGYGFPDAAPGTAVQLSTTAVCVDRGATASVTGVRFAGSEAPTIEAFAIQRRTTETVGGYRGSAPEAMDDTVAITDPCPAKDPLVVDETGQGLVVRATVPDLEGRVDLRALEVDYVVDGDEHTAEVPIAVAICPPGDVEAADDDCSTSDAEVD